MSRSPGGRRPSDSLQSADAAFKKATTKPIEGTAQAPAISGVKETVTLHINQDVLEFFQEDGPGWQDRINAAPREASSMNEDRDVAQAGILEHCSKRRLHPKPCQHMNGIVKLVTADLSQFHMSRYRPQSVGIPSPLG